MDDCTCGTKDCYGWLPSCAEQLLSKRKQRRRRHTEKQRRMGEGTGFHEYARQHSRVVSQTVIPGPPPSFVFLHMSSAFAFKIVAPAVLMGRLIFMFQIAYKFCFKAPPSLRRLAVLFLFFFPFNTKINSDASQLSRFLKRKCLWNHSRLSSTLARSGLWRSA